MFRSFFVFITILILISACTPALQATPQPDQPTTTSSPLPTATPTRTALPSATPTASITPLPTIPTFTPTFDVSTIVTVTPAPKAECPLINENIDMGIDFHMSGSNSLDTINQKILNFLNNGGSPKIILNTIRAQYYRVSDLNPNRLAITSDVTGDGVSELLIAPHYFFSIFGCKNGEFKALYTSTTPSVNNIDIRAINDINRNGIPEIYEYINECMGAGCHILNVLEWNGSKFANVISDDINDPDHYCHDIGQAFELGFRDIDNDNWVEIILEGKAPIWPDWVMFPYRDETRICKWNGQGVVFYRKEFSKPKYRFQALQDADLAVQQREDTKALDLYQQTIFNSDLEWWSSIRRANDFEFLVLFGAPTPTPDPNLVPDPAEYPRLAAYAYYRIMLLHLVQGYESDATTVYNTLQEKFSNDPYGQPYVEMATAFWDAYQSTHKMYDGCAAAIQYAAEHPEILTPLGSDYHGSQSHQYKPEDVCPFR